MTHEISIQSAVHDVVRYLPRWIGYQVDQRRVPGAQVAVRLDDLTVFSQAFGHANLDTGEPLTTRHLFRIASHSKWFTATLVMRLVEAGTLRLDDTLGGLAPAYADTELSGVTLRELLSHQGGIIRDGVDTDFWQLDGQFHDAGSLLRLVRTHGKVFAANEHFKYTNIGFSLIGQILESVTGTPYNELVSREVCEPLGLTNTAPEYDDSRASEYAAGHSRARIPATERTVLTHVDTRAMSPATGFCSTAEDLTAFGAVHFLGSGQLLSDGSRRRMQRRESIIENGGQTGYYGLGTQIYDIGDRRVVGHSGGFPGHITRTYVDPEDRIVVSVLTNAVDGPADPIAVGIVKLINLAMSGRKSWQADSPTDRLDSFVGRYDCLWGTTDIVRLGGRLVGIDPSVGDPASDVDEATVLDDMTLEGERRDSYGHSGEPLTFERDENGRAVSFRSAGQTSRRVDD